ncbi:MAG: hypothetical protein VXX58_02880 [Pseudomonadota bacterium]|nr:hypothetical protein [Pseudomonadota bacterium]
MTDMKAHDQTDCHVMIYQARESDHMLVEVWTYPDLAAKTRCLEKMAGYKGLPSGTFCYGCVNAEAG